MGSNPQGSDGRSIGEVSEGGASFDDDNPFELSDGLRWYLLDAAEEKAGAPTTPGLGKSTVASAHVDARGSIRVKKSSGGNDASKTLNKSLDSRRSSSNSKKSVTAAPTLMDTVVDAEAPSPADASPIRLRSGSQASAARPGTGTGTGTGTGSGQAQVQMPDGDEPLLPSLPPIHSPIESDLADPSLSTQDGLKPPPSSAGAGAPPPAPAQPRSTSPSKSVRSLTRNLEVSPGKNPAKAKSGGPGGIWESLWQLDVSLESGKGK
ncbi:hypothetical protein LTR39_006558, partial [Cryomyces antarcticus]